LYAALNICDHYPFRSVCPQIHHQIFIYRLGHGVAHYPWPSARCQMQGDKEWRKMRISHTLQEGTTAVNAAGGTLMVDQGPCNSLTFQEFLISL